ncbi:hypothetical protein NC653_001513 [Populus alba x Populus x berolinensis]|uniref:Uncharacterized protein n=1 Tax=Populus alba x Populus x berolinensis TaxID=444605 RepID=A0AAD6RLM3_9ROSI|nr:hypothetical protein NC653_001513 [Populus alba x Populus x berolinensis]
MQGLVRLLVKAWFVYSSMYLMVIFNREFKIPTYLGYHNSVRSVPWDCSTDAELPLAARKGMASSITANCGILSANNIMAL